MMKNSIYIISVLIILSFSAKGGHQIDPRDTFHCAKSEYKLSHKQFLEKYGTDDSAKALINIYFEERSEGFIDIPLATIAVIFIESKIDHNYVYPGREGTLNEYAMPTGIASVCVYLVISSSRKSLLKELKYYQLKGYFSKDYGILVKEKICRMRRKTAQMERRKKKEKNSAIQQ